MRILVAPDKFKGTATAVDVSQALANGLTRVRDNIAVVRCPLADGGEGTLEALGGPNRSSPVTGPLGDEVVARWRMAKPTAVIEMAQASGLVVAGGPQANHPIDASTRGTGELIMTAIERGARRVIVAVGGSATTDGGWGATEVVGSRARLRGIELIVACDVGTRFTDAAKVFGPQKGATPKQVAFLTARLQGLVDRYRDEFGIEVDQLAGSGAAGGLAGGLAALGAELVGGFELVAEEVGLDHLISTSDLVVTGEGQLDEQSFNGKVVGGVCQLASVHRVPVHAVVGSATDAGRALAAERNLTVHELVAEVGERAAFDNPTHAAETVAASILR